MKAVSVVVGIGILTAGFATNRVNSKVGTPQVKTIPVAKPIDALQLPTAIVDGIMTEKQRIHSRLFTNLRWGVSGKLIERVAIEGDVRTGNFQPDVLVPGDFDLSKYVAYAKCSADAVVVGTVKNKASQMIEKGTYVFTDYVLAVDDVLKNNSDGPIQLNSDITVTRIGGVVSIYGHTISAQDNSQRVLRVGQRYLLFLRFIPETRAYKSLDAKGGFRPIAEDDTFQIRDDQIVQVSDNPLPFGQGVAQSEAAFLSQIRSADGKCPI